mmetsp:Transcript_47646/g.137603  ORF Transcript_47646/g.137603 Transcript_47646/m.137603 type:complete len:185 (+) Transcript_47646:136-690(+)
MSWQLHKKNVTQMTKVKVSVGGSEEWVDIDPTKGPMVNNPDGSQTDMRWLANGNRIGKIERCGYGPGNEANRMWHMMTATEQELVLHAVAKKNKKLREWQQETGYKGQGGLPDFLQHLPMFLARNKIFEEAETQRWLTEKMNNIGIKEPKAKAKTQEEKPKVRKHALGEAPPSVYKLSKPQIIA